MTNEERDIITQVHRPRRRRRRPAAQPARCGGSVPATTQPALPPVDREADALIGEMFQRYPEARYRMTQLAFVQEHALAEAQNRLKQMEWKQQAAASRPAGRATGAAAAEQQPAAGSSAGCSAAVAGGRRSRRRTGTGLEPGRIGARLPAAIPAGRATAAAICPELPAGHVPALRVRVPRLGADHRGRRRPAACWQPMR